MKKCLLMLLSVLLLLSGCTPRTDAPVSAEAAPKAVPETPVPETPAPVESFASVLVFSAEPTATPQPSPTPTPTPTPSPTPTPTPTPTPVPTPSPEPTPVPSWVPTDVPSTDGAIRLQVFLGNGSTKQSVVAYRSVDKHWEVERIMICSGGWDTPQGTFRITDKYEYHSLFGSKGQYCSRFQKSCLFHSVPIDDEALYQKEGVSRMRTGYYKRLGSYASHGCVRMLCIDAKWIYDNCPPGTKVVINRKAGPEPPEPPELIAGEPYESGGFGWDPTDPDEKNPYRDVYGIFN